MDLRTTIAALANEFASQVITSLQKMPLEELVHQVGAMGARPVVSAAKARPAAAPASAAPAKQPKRKGRLARRSADDIAQMIDSIIKLLQKHPQGLRAEQLRTSLGIEAKELPRPITEALTRKLITRKGEKRATTYFVRSAKPAVSKPAAKASPKKRGAPPKKKAVAKKKAAAPKNAEANGIASEEAAAASAE